MKMHDHILGMEIIAYDKFLHPIVKDKAHRVFTALPDGRFVLLRVPHCPSERPTKSSWDFMNCLGQKEKKP